MTRTDLLEPYGRNEPCWCGSQRKYKQCHGNHRPPSLPGAPVPPDSAGSTFISPTTALAKGAIRGLLPAGTPITWPTGKPTPTAITFTNWEEDLGRAGADGADALDAEALGGLRLEVLSRLAALPDTGDIPSDNTVAAVYQLTAETVRSVAHLARLEPKRTILWNQELDLAKFLGRTLLLADHVLYPDRVFDVVLRRESSKTLKDAAQRQLMHAQFLAASMTIPVPPGVAMAARGRAAIDQTAGDLGNPALVDWVRRQLIVEGPTAREALLVRAIDDLATEPANLWLHGRIDTSSLDTESGQFGTSMLMPYEPDFDYDPWISQVKNSAVSALVQRTNERVVTADVFGSEYVSASLFEARLLRYRSRDTRIGAAQAALWADIPELTTLTSPELAKVLKHEAAVEDLRRQVRASLATARTDAENIEAITGLAHELEAASHSLQRTARSDRGWQGVLPAGLGMASIVIGGITGGLVGLGAGTLGALGALAPYLGARLSTRRNAAYLFVAARRTQK